MADSTLVVGDRVWYPAAMEWGTVTSTAGKHTVVLFDDGDKYPVPADFLVKDLTGHNR